MSRLIESIRIKDGEFSNLHYHQARIDNSISELKYQPSSINLQEHLEQLDYPKVGLFKCRIVYDRLVHQIEFIPYVQKLVNSLKVVHDNEIEYGYKFEDRAALDKLYSQRENCDDIIISKNGFVTDSSYSNLIFYTGEEWITPEIPLLKGIMRQLLLDQGKIKTAQIRVEDISGYESCCLINAMLGFEGPELSISQIVS